MFMGQVTTSPEAAILRELENARILITGLTSTTGVDVARAFADLKARLVVHTNDLSSEVTELFAVLSQSASEIRLFTSNIASSEQAVQFAQTSAQAYGGLDAVINLAAISVEETDTVESEFEVERLVQAKLSPLAQLTRVTANRMRVVCSEGMVLNVLTMPHPGNGRIAAIATLARATLAAMTHHEAHAWAGQGIRINAIGPRVVAGDRTNPSACLTNEPDIAALALYLASRRGRTLSGHVFDAESLGADLS